MTFRDQLILILLLFCFVLFIAAVITRKRGGLFIIDYNDLYDQSPDREDERKKGEAYANFIFKWIKYFVGVLLLFFSYKIIVVLGGIIIILSAIYDRKSS